MNILDRVDANLVEQAIQASQERMKTQREGYFWPSECSVEYRPIPSHPEIIDPIGSCRRKVYWRFHRVAPTNQPHAGSIRTMTMGKAIEQKELDWYDEFGFGIARNFKFQDPSIRVSGEGDALVFDPTAGIVGVEVKSFYGEKAFREIMGSKTMAGFPRLDNLLQVMYYLYVTRLSQWRLVYITREHFEHRQFAVGLDEEGYPIVEDRDAGFSTVFKGFTIHDSIRRMQELYEMIGRKELPPRDFVDAYTADEVEARFQHGLISKTRHAEWLKNPGANPIRPWQCDTKYCGYYDLCHGNVQST